MIRKTTTLSLAFSFLTLLFFRQVVTGQYAMNVSQAVTAATITNKWKPMLIEDLSSVKVAPPPNAAQSAKELAEVKKKMKEADVKMLQQIRYWDAGAPSYRWNEIAGSIINFENINTFFRFPAAWMNMAIYDATLAAWKAKYNYNRKRPFEDDKSIFPLVAGPMTPSYPCEHTVTAAAAATVLAYFYPEKADSILQLARQASQSRIYAGVQYPSDVAEAWKLGEQIANNVIEQAKKHMPETQFNGEMPTDPKLWHGEYPVGRQVVFYKPIVMRTANQFRPAAPPDFKNEMKEMKEFKQDFRSTLLALKWAAVSGIEVWNDLASKKIFEEHLDRNTPYCARLYAILQTAIYDASIAIMDAKYAYWGIRPNQYDKDFKPLIFTPPFPGYPSGHATASSAAATVLSYFFPSDITAFKQTAQECADSRFYGGIHFKTDNEVGLKMGEDLAKFILQACEKKDGFAIR